MVYGKGAKRKDQKMSSQVHLPVKAIFKETERIAPWKSQVINIGKPLKISIGSFKTVVHLYLVEAQESYYGYNQ